jgi:tetratricopeptide (TPR) repeat protein
MAASRHDSAAALAQSTARQSKWRRYILALSPLLLIIMVAFAAYANAWPNTLVHDDKFYRGSERFAELSNIPRYFTENAWASSGVSENLYRPLLLLSVTLDARLYGDWVAGYHLTNIALHGLVTILLFGLLVQMLRMTKGEFRTDSPVALLVALIFAVHPVYAEVVNSIFNRSEMLVALTGLAGLLWLLRHMNARPAVAWAGLGLAYLLALLCKESAMMLPALAVLLAWVLTPGDWRVRLQKCLPVFWLLIPLALYLGLRIQALAPVVAEGAAAEVSGTGLSGMSVMLDELEAPGGRLLMYIAGLYYESFRIMLWPVSLSIMHGTASLFSRYSGLALNLALVSFAIYEVKSKRYGFFLGLFFFYIALLPSSRIIGDPGVLPHLAERYLYFPSVGLAIVLAFGLRYLARRFDVLWLASVVVLLVMMLTPITWARNALWANEVQLFETEYSQGNYSSTVLVWLTGAHLRDSGAKRVANVCDRHIESQELNPKLSLNCAVAYKQLGRLDEAERAYLFGTAHKSTRAIAHANLGRFYLDQDRWSEAKKHFEMAVEAERLPANRAFRKGHMLVRLYPSDRQKLLEAKALFEEALELQPTFAPARHWLARVNQALGVR